MTPRKLVSLVLLCGAIVVTDWGAVRLGLMAWSGIGNGPTGNRQVLHRATPSSVDAGDTVDTLSASTPNSAAAAATSDLNLPESAVAAIAVPDSPENTPVLAGLPAAEAPTLETSSAESDPTPPPATRTRLVSLSTLRDVPDYPKSIERPIETPNECLVAEICIDDYLWSLYERTPKVDTNKVTEKIKTTVKKKGKTRTVIKTLIKYVVGDFTWKDPIAAQRAGMSLKDYVIGGMDRSFKQKLYYALRAMDNAGLMPGITSAFRDNYRQSIASGNKAASDSSYHGGSRRGGYGHALAVDLVSVQGANRMERYASSEKLWRWIDTHEQELGIGRPYLDKDPPHVAPIDGKEYADKRGPLKAQLAGLKRASSSSDPK